MKPTHVFENIRPNIQVLLGFKTKHVPCQGLSPDVEPLPLNLIGISPAKK